MRANLLQIAETVAEVPARGKVAEAFERIGSGLLKLPPLSRNDLVNAMRRHVDACRGVRDIWPAQAARLADVATDPALGPSIARALEVLGDAASTT
jgi:hypothetical protein